MGRKAARPRTSRTLTEPIVTAPLQTTFVATAPDNYATLSGRIAVIVDGTTPLDPVLRKLNRAMGGAILRLVESPAFAKAKPGSGHLLAFPAGVAAEADVHADHDHGVVEADLHVEPGHQPPGLRADLVDAVLDHAGVLLPRRAHARAEGALPRRGGRRSRSRPILGAASAATAARGGARARGPPIHPAPGRGAERDDGGPYPSRARASSPSRCAPPCVEGRG